MPEVGRQREIVAALSRRVIDEELDVAGAVQELTRIPGIGLTELGALGVLQQQIAAQNDASNALAQTPERRKEAARLSSIETAQSLGFDGEYLDGFTGETHHDYQLLEFLEELAEARATKSDSLFAIQYREARIAEFIAAENDRSPALRVLSALDSAEEALHQAVSGGMTGTQLTFKQVQLMAAAEPDNPRWLRIQDQLLNQMGAEFILAKHREQNAPQDVIEYDEARLAALTHPKDHALRKRADELYAALAEKYPFPTTSNENPHRERSEAPPASSPAPTSVSPVPRRRWNLLGRHSARKPR